MIKRKKIDLSEENRILTQMIISTPFLSELKNIATPHLFKSSFSITVASWIWEYFSQTEEAPQKAIEDVYLKNRHLIGDEDENELIGTFLGELSANWERNKVNNVKYSVTAAIEFFKLRSLEKLRDEIGEAVESKNAAQGELLLSNYRNVEKITGFGVSLLNDNNAVKSAFLMEQEILFSLPKLLGKSMGPFHRGDFLAILGAPKKGKTWMLMFVAIRAVLCGLKVVFFSFEMNKDPVIRRLWKMFTGQPSKKERIEIACFEEGEESKYQIATHTKSKEGVVLSDITGLQQKYKKASRGGDLRTHSFPSNTATTKDMDDFLKNLAYYENYIPDVIVCDYADIVLPVNSRMEYRHQLNSIWLGLRSMAQKWEALTVTGSQTGRVGISGDAASKDVAEDMRKIAHVTHFGILNQNEKEKEAGVMRYKVGEVRESKGYQKELVMLQSLDIGRPYLDCKVINEVDMTPFAIEKKKGKKKKDK